MVALGVGVWATVALAAAPHVTAFEHDGSNYARRVGGVANVEPRKAVAQRFFQNHGDQYDFLIVFPTFAADFGSEVVGLHFGVSNEVQGIGHPVGSSAALFGSGARLKGYIDIGALMPGGSDDLQSIMGVTIHELAHQWSGRARVVLPGASLGSDEILDGEGHWSFFLDSNASVLYGSDWVAANGSYVSAGSRKRLSELDLYLMGFASPLEVPPQTLLRGAGHAAGDLPPPDGTTIQATAVPFTIDDLIAANGPRIPGSISSQKSFRAAFIILSAPGTAPTPAQLATVEAARRQLSNEFFFQTRGRGVMETELVELAPGAVATNPSAQAGVAALLAMQRADGAWSDTSATTARETASALETLSAFQTITGVIAAQGRGADWLTAAQPKSVDVASRRISGLASSLRSADATVLERWRGASGAFGSRAGYQPTPIDSALALDALLDLNAAPEALTPIVDWLFAQQAADGGWPMLAGGPSRIESTALVLMTARRLPSLSSPRVQALTRAFAFLRARRSSDGSFSDDVKSAAATAHAVQALGAWQQLSATEATTATSFLLSQQLTDGSWQASAYQTAEALKGLRAALSANLSVSAPDISLSSSSVTEGEPVQAQVVVRNTGLSTVPVTLQAFDSSGTPLSAPQSVASVSPGSAATFTLQLDTTGHAGSSQVFFVVDPLGEIDEFREDDNRAGLALLVRAPSVLPDLYVGRGSLAAAPSVLRGPTTLVVSGLVGNAGLTAANTVVVSLRLNGVEVATTVVDLAAQAQRPFSLSTSVTPTSTSAAIVEVVVDPADLFVEDVEANNSLTLAVPVASVVDLSVASLTVPPAALPQGSDVPIGVTIQNVGTLATADNARVEVFSGATPVATLPVAIGTLVPGASVLRTVSWRANVSGTFTVRASITAVGDVEPLNDTRTATLTVSPSALANLTTLVADSAVSPNPPLEGQGATVTSVIRNTGGAITSPFEVAIYSGSPSAGGTLLARSTIAGLAGGAQTIVTASVPVVGGAPLDVVTVADEGDAIEEFDETDNSSVVTWTPARFADLIVVSADLRTTPLFPRSGDPVNVTVSVFNAGGQTANQVRVRLDGTSGSGYATQTVSIGPQSRGEVTFALTGLTGATTLSAEVNDDRAVTELRYDNNTATRVLSVQSAALALSNPWFSPNGDGIKDTTEVLAQLTQGSHLEFEVFDRAGVRVRTVTGSTWDGTDDQGRLVEDDSYRIEAWAVGGSRSALGTVQAVVDTNHLLVTRTVGTPFFVFDPAARGQPTFDDQATLYSGTEPDAFGVQRLGAYLREFGGSTPRRLTPLGWTQNQLGGAPSPSPDGRSFVNTVFDPASGQSAVRIFDWVAGTSRILAVGASGSPVFDSTGRWVLAPISTGSSRQLEVIDAVTGARRVLVSFFWIMPSEQRFSPDGNWVSYTLDTEVFVVPTSGGVPASLPFAGPTGQVFAEFGFVASAPQYAWRASSDRIVYTTTGVVRHVTDPTECHAIVYESDSEYEPPASCFVGEGGLRELTLGSLVDTQIFTDPGYAIAATNPVLVASPRGESIVLQFAEERTGLGFTRSHPLAAFEHGVMSVLDFRLVAPPQAWSPGGTFVLAGPAAGSDANGKVRITATRTPGGGSLTLSGNATDWNFDEYELSVRPLGSSSWTVLQRANQNVRNARFLEWTPSSPGRWEVSVTVRDRAGNSRTATAQAGWSTSPAISSLTVSPLLFSPNGDGAKDTMAIGYFVNAPVTSDFAIENASGVAVRNFARTDLVSGTQSFVWDGRSGSGAVVPDGTYRLEVENLSATLTVDTTPPAVSLILGDGVSPEPFVSRRRIVLGGPNLFAPRPLDVPAIQTPVTWQASDLHFVNWELQEIDTNGSGVVSLLDSSPSQSLRTVHFPLGRGPFRLSALDAADNVALSSIIRVPERFFVVGTGDADELVARPGAVFLDGVAEPRIDMLSSVRSVGPITPAGTRRELAAVRHAFQIDDTVERQIVSYFVVRTPLLGGAPIVDTANVTLLSPHVLVWDARLVTPGNYDVEICATDSSGSVFCDTIEYRAASGGVRVCTDPGGSRAVLKVFSNSSAPLELVDSQGVALASATTSFTLPASGCRFRLRNLEENSLTPPIDTCGLHLRNVSVDSAGNVDADIEETFDEEIIDARLQIDGRWFSIGAFSGWHHFARSLPTLPCQAPVQFNYEVELATGITVSGSAEQQLSEDGVRFNSCKVPDPRRACVDPLLNFSATRGPSATCAAADPDAQLAATATATAGQVIVALTLGYENAQGQRFELSSLSPGTASATLSTTLHTDQLPEGAYRLFAELVQDNGVRKREEVPLSVDRLSPQVIIDTPLAGQRVCGIPNPVQRGFLFRAQGRVLDANADQARFRLLSAGTEIESEVAFVGNPIVQWPLTGGDYEVVLEGSDRAGNSSCTATPFHFIDPIAIRGWGSALPILAPDGDGQFEQTNLTFDLNEPAAVTITATPLTGGTPVPLFALSANAGITSLVWSGRDDHGDVLADGDYELELIANDECSLTARAKSLVRIDTTPPVARLDTPLNGASVRAVLPVAGEASDLSFERAQLRLSDGLTVATLDTSTTPRLGVWGAFPLSAFTPGTYELELFVTDAVGHSSIAVRTITVGGTRLLADVVGPLWLSPNGDGRLDSAPLTWRLDAPAAVTVELVGPATSTIATRTTSVGPQSLTLDATTLGAIAEGTYAVRVTASDATGSEAEEVPLIIDVTPPSVSVRSPVPGAFVPGSVSVSASIADVNPLTWVVDGPNAAHRVGVTNFDGVVALLSGLPEGPNELLLEATDLAENSTQVRVSFNSDTVPPFVSFTQPLAGAFVSGVDGPVEVRGQVVEQDVASVSLTAGPTTLFSGASLPGSVPWNAGTESDGPRELVLTARDRAGNESQARLAVIIDNTPPVALITAPRSEVLRLGEFRGTASDVNFLAYQLEVAANGGQFFTVGDGTNPVTSGVLGQLLTAPAEGAWVARLTVTDRAGNTAVELSPFTVDLTPPLAVALTVSRTGPTSAHLEWTSSASPDVVSYVVVDQLGTSIVEVSTAASPIDLTSLIDGTHHFTVLAVDAAGLRSSPSNDVPFVADSTPPVVVISSPRGGERIRGNSIVQGSVLATDLFEYRLRLGAGVAPSTFTTIATGSTEVQAAQLGLLDTAGLAQGTTYTLRLEADDQLGNTAATQETFVVDDVAPAAPVLLSATPSVNNVNVIWQLNAEPDVIGYLVFRNFQLVNGPAGSVSDPLPYLLPATQSSYFHAGLPDGVHAYRVQAVDAAGNVSPLSNELIATINRRAPVASIVSPSMLARLTQQVTVVADSADEDVASMHLEARGAGGAWVTLANLSAPPWTASLDPAGFTNPIEVRATATDTFGAVDPAPQAATFFYAPAIAAPVLSRTVNGTLVNLSWVDPNSLGAVSGFNVSRNGIPLGNASRPAGTFSATSGVPQNAWDGNFSTVWRTASSAFPQTWQVDFTTPTLLSNIGVGFLTSPTWDLELRVNGTWVAALRGALNGRDVPLGGALLVQGIRVTVRADQFGRADMWEVLPTVVPTTGDSTFASANNALGTHSFVVEATSSYGALASSTTQAVVYRPLLDALSASTSAATLQVSGTNARAGDDVELRVGGVVAAHATADAAGAFDGIVPLAPGPNVIDAVAVSPSGDRSVPSASATVTRANAPTASIALSLDSVTGSNVALSFVVSGDTSDVSSFVVSRVGPGQSAPVGSVGAAARTFIDANVPNGTWRYTVTAFNSAQVPGTSSNEVEAVVEVPVVAPAALVVVAVPSGKALALTWTWSGTPAGGFVVERASAVTGPYTVIANGLATNSLQDANLPEASTWWYRVFARDALGNLSPSSNVASGTVHDSERPDAPVITGPTVAGAPITTTNAVTTVTGLAEASSTVILRKNGVVAGSRAAGALAVLDAPFNNTFPFWSVVAGSPRGDLAAWTAYLTEPVIVLGAPARLERAVVLNGNYPATLRFAPDGTQLAVELQAQSDGRRSLAIIDPASATLSPLLPPMPGEQSVPTWSADSRELFFVIDSPPALPAIARSVVGSGTFSVIATISSLQSPVPVVHVGGTLYVRGYDFTAFTDSVIALNLTTGATSTVFSANNGLSAIASSPGHSIVAYSDWAPNVFALDLATGMQRQLGVGNALGISPDGTEVLSSWWPSLSVTSVAGGAPLLVRSNFNGSADWLGRGVVLTESNQQLTHVQWGGRFEFPNVPLQVGANVFTAEAQDEGGNVSPRSQSIQVTRDASNDADLSVSLELLPAVPVATRPASLVVTVRNLGVTASPATQLTARVFPAVGATQFLTPLPVPALTPGQSVRLTMPFAAAGLSGPGNTAEAEVDAAGAIADSNRSNNFASATFTVVPTTDVALTLTAAPSQVSAFESFTSTLELHNPGGARALSLQLFVVAADGVRALDIDALPLGLVAPDARLTVIRTANTGALAPGNYEVVAEVTEAGVLAARTTAPLIITVERAASIRLTTSRARYFEGAAVTGLATVTNTSRNAAFDNGAVEWRLVDSTGTQRANGTVGVPMLAMGSSASVAVTLAAPPPGDWVLEADVWAGTSTLATTSTTFVVDGRAILTGGLSVRGATTSPPTLAAGDALFIDLSLANGGSTAATTVQATLSLVDGVGGVQASRAFSPGSIASGAAAADVAQFDTSGLRGLYLATLVVSADGIAAFEVARQLVRITDGAAPALVVLAPTQGALVAASPTLRVEASDATGVSLVRVELDGVTTPLTAFSGTPWNGEWRLTAALSDGPHTAVFSALDVEGNDGLTRPNASNPATINFTVDSTPPVISITGVIDGQLRNTSVVPHVTVQDTHPGPVRITLNGAPFTNGSAVDVDGHWVLEVFASDAAGNQSQARVEFDVDRTAPLIAAFGFIDGSHVSSDVSPGYTVTDAHPVAVVATLDGAPFVSGMLVASEGLHLLRVDAQDSAGNAATFAGTFTIDRSAPVLTLTGFVPGELTSRVVTPGVSASDASLLSVERRLDGLFVNAGAPVSTEGIHTYSANAIDRAGNTASASGSFTIDRTPPLIAVTGVTDGQRSSAPLQPVVVVTDLHLTTTSVTLDGAPFISGTVVASAGAHTLVVNAADGAGNTATQTVRFELARAAPLVVSWSGFVEGAVVQGPVVPTLVVSGAATATSATLDGAPFVSGTAVSTEGPHTVVGTASDVFGTETATGHFTIDRTPPLIVITGVVDGQVGSAPVTPVVSVTELHPGTVSITLNGAPFVSGTTVANTGTWLLRVDAVDVAGNASSTSVSFTIQQSQSVVVTRGPSSVPRVLALLESSGCRSSNRSRLEQTLRAALGPEAVLRTTSSRPSFLNDLRSGGFNLFVVASTGCSRDHDHHHGDGCGDDDDDDDDDDHGHGWDWDDRPSYSAGSSNWNSTFNLRSRISNELTELVFSGHAGLVVVASSDSDLDLREVTGVTSTNNSSARTLQFVAGTPISGSGPLSLDAPRRSLTLNGALGAATYQPFGGFAAATRVTGLGRTVTYGFDPADATPPASATLSLSRALSWVSPPASQSQALLVNAVRIDTANPTSASFNETVTETLTSPMRGIDSLPNAQLLNVGTRLQWQASVAAGQSKSFTYWTRLPDAAGTWPVTTEVRIGSTVTTRTDAFSTTLTGAALFANALAGAQALPNGSRRTAILAALARVQARTIQQRADLDANIADLLGAARDANALGTAAATQVRQRIDHLIVYWEARWYVY